MRFPVAQSRFHFYGGETFLSACSHLCCATWHAWTTKNLERTWPCLLSPLQGELLQPESLMGSESSEGLQGVWVSDRFPAREHVTRPFFTRWDRGVQRFLWRSECWVCMHLPPPRVLASLRPPPAPILQVPVHPVTLLAQRAGMGFSP